MTKRIFIFILSLFLIPTLSVAQDDEYVTSPDAEEENESPAKNNKFDWSKFYTGGGLGASFGDVTLIAASPVFGYRFTEQLSAGMNVTYMYYSERRYNYKTHVFGGGPFARYLIIENMFAHVEYQVLNAEYYDVYGPYRASVNYLWVGGGYRQELATNAYFSLTALWDINQDPRSIYPNPVLRMGITAGL